MKKLSFILTAFFLALVSCSSDSYMERLNTDPSKAATIDPNAQLTTAELQTYGDLVMQEEYRSYIYAFTQQLMGCWNTTYYGGRHTIDNDQMSHFWIQLYTNGIKNLVDAANRTQGDESYRNINAIVNIYKVYLMSIITDIYGDAPYSEAGLGFINENATPRFDTQKEIYYSFFNQLDSAERQLDASADRITGDLIYSGDVSKWKKLANSLRLRFAMRISNVEPEKAQTEFEKALAADGGVISNADDDALIKYMSVAISFAGDAYNDFRGNRLSQLFFGNDPANNPTYLCSTFFNYLLDTGDPRTFRIARCYYDGLMSLTSPDNRVDLTQEMLDKGISFQPRDPGAYSWDPWPTGYDSDILKAMAETNSDIVYTTTREVEPKLASNFLSTDNPGVIMTSAEVKFLKAEAKLMGWNIDGTVEELYKEGVREAMTFLSDNYGCDVITDQEFNDYMDKNPLGYTKELQKQAINTQAWILHFHNPAECWANLRRSGYPRLLSPAEYGFASFLTGGNDIPVRLCYPVLESSYNKANYQEALDRMGGTDNWHTNVWWDK